MSERAKSEKSKKETKKIVRVRRRVQDLGDKEKECKREGE